MAGDDTDDVMERLNPEASETIPLDEEKNGRPGAKLVQAETKEDDIDVEVEITDTITMKYGLEVAPPWYTCLSVGLQHYLLMFGPTISIPFILVSAMCIENKLVEVSELVGNVFFSCGLVTLLQTTIGIRLGLVHGVAFAHVVPAMAILNLEEWKCTTGEDLLPPCESSHNDSYTFAQNCTENPDKWKARLMEVQGAVMIASAFEVLCGVTGVVGLLTRVAGPLTLAPTVALLGLSLFEPAALYASKQWWIALFTTVLIMLFSLILRSCTVPCWTFKPGYGCTRFKYPLFQMFPVILAVIIVWFLCAILTVTNVFPQEKGAWGYEARSDSRIQVLYDAPWIRIPYPGQWGLPTASASSVLGMMAGVLAAMVNSVGNYYSCARLAEVPMPPNHAINRGIAVDGIGNILAAALNAGVGTLSSSQNIAVIGMTQVASRRVFQAAGAITMVLALFGKFGAFFVTIPAPIIGGFFFAFSGLITAVGISNLQHINMNSSRNLFIFGFSIFFGLSLPHWLKYNEEAIKTGLPALDNVLRVLGTTMMFVGGMSGLILDNIVPGTPEERGLKAMHKATGEESEDLSCYDLPLVMGFVNSWKWTRYIPVCPTFKGINCRCRRRNKKEREEATKC